MSEAFNPFDTPLSRELFAVEVQQLQGQEVTITLPKLTLLLLISQIQLASRYPHNHGPSRRESERFVRLMQDIWFPPETLIGAVVEQGWHPEFDVEAEGPASASDNRPSGLHDERNHS